LNIRKIFDLILFSLVYVFLSIFIRPRKNQREKIIGFVEAQFTGNVKYLYLEMVKYPNVKVFFVTDKKNIERLSGKGVDVRYYVDVKSVPLFLRTHAWVTSDGPYYIPFVGVVGGFIPFFRWKHGSKWIDVGHGIGFKDAGRKGMLKNYDYDLGIVTSEFLREYFSREGFPSKKLKITGFPRNDPLIDKRWSEDETERKLCIPKGHKNILYTPTWGHERKKPIFPWETTSKFLQEVEKFCEENNCNFLIRMHINWYHRNIKEAQVMENEIKRAERIFHVASYEYDDVQPLLFISDVLITDWSSIANDFILLDRPIIFLDIELPVEKFVLTPEDRAGYIVRNKQEFFEKLQEALDHPDLFEKRHKGVLKKAYKHLDGDAAKRCAKEILKLLRD